MNQLLIIIGVFTAFAIFLIVSVGIMYAQLLRRIAYIDNLNNEMQNTLKQIQDYEFAREYIDNRF